ncbi:MAG: hypothetical protein R6V58_07645 [Planctomycetota bacterium]
MRTRNNRTYRSYGTYRSYRATCCAALTLLMLAATLALAAPARAAEALDLRVTTDRSIDPSSIETICKSVCKPGMTERERALAVWRMFNTKMFHWDRISSGHWDVICTYGYSLCGTMWRTMSMFHLYEFGDGSVRGGGFGGWMPDSEWGRLMMNGWLVDSYLMTRKHMTREKLYGPYDPKRAKPKPVKGGHTMGELKFDGKFHLLDPHAGFYVYTADGKDIASSIQIASDPSLVSDPVKKPERFMPCDVGQPLFYYRAKGGSRGKGGGKKPKNQVFPTNLRAGLKYIRYYGKTFPHAYVYRKGWERMPDWYREGGPRHLCNNEDSWRHYGNGEVVFEPAKNELWREAIVKSENLADDLKGGLHAKDPAKPWSLTVEFQTPYVFVGENVTGTVTGEKAIVKIRRQGKYIWLTTKVNPRAPAPVRHAGGKINVMPGRITKPLGRKLSYTITGGPGARVDGLRLAPVFQYNYFMSPRPKPGENKVKVTWSDKSAMTDRGVRVTWTWREKAGARKNERVITKSGTEYDLPLGPVDIEPSAELNPTYIDALTVELVPAGE